MRQYILALLCAAMLFACTQNNTNQKAPAEKNSVSPTAIDTGKTNTKKDTAAGKLVLTPLNITGDIGYITFSQKGKTVFYYDAKLKSGKIMLNGTEYILSKIAGAYTLSGKDIAITTTKGEWGAMESDCAYGRSLSVTIKTGTQTLQLDNVDVQDCSGMVE